ncbi:MAG: PstS family phosphate ABC transporter substrate-binding protein [Pirellulaceae bacterium]|nr:PstS family phosphate ABC transporter substrate-binding protein [Planctomycetales bacterium]
MIKAVQPKVAVSTFLCLLAIVTAGCQRPQESIRIDGSSTVFPVSEAMTEIYRDVSPETLTDVGFSGTGGGFKKLIQGELDICDASRPVKEAELSELAAQGIELVELQIAYDGLAVVVNPGNDWCSCLTVAQLKELWRPNSSVKKWSDMNPDWPNETINLFGPGTDSGTFDYFCEAIVGEEKASRQDYTQNEDDNFLVRGIAEDKYALGYFGLAYYLENKDTLKLVGVDNGSGCILPSPDTVNDGTYTPLSRPLFIYVTKQALSQRADVVDFVKYYLEHAAEVAAKVGYVPVPDDVAAANNDKLLAALAE